MRIFNGIVVLCFLTLIQGCYLIAYKLAPSIIDDNEFSFYKDTLRRISPNLRFDGIYIFRENFDSKTQDDYFIFFKFFPNGKVYFSNKSQDAIFPYCFYNKETLKNQGYGYYTCPTDSVIKIEYFINTRKMWYRLEGNLTENLFNENLVYSAHYNKKYLYPRRGNKSNHAFREDAYYEFVKANFKESDDDSCSLIMVDINDPVIRYSIP